MDNLKSYSTNEFDANELYKELNEIIQIGIGIKKKYDEQAKFFTKLDQSFMTCRNKVKALVPDVDSVEAIATKETPVIALKHNYKKGEKHEPSNAGGAKELKMVPEEVSYDDLITTITSLFGSTAKARKEMDRMTGNFKTLMDDLTSHKATGIPKQMIDTIAKFDKNQHKPGNLEYFREGKDRVTDQFKAFAKLLNFSQVILDGYIFDSREDFVMWEMLNTITLHSYAFIKKFFGELILRMERGDDDNQQYEAAFNVLIEVHRVVESYQWHIASINKHSIEALQAHTKLQNFNSRFLTIQALFFEKLFD